MSSPSLDNEQLNFFLCDCYQIYHHSADEPPALFTFSPAVSAIQAHIKHMQHHPVDHVPFSFYNNDFQAPAKTSFTAPDVSLDDCHLCSNRFLHSYFCFKAALLITAPKMHMLICPSQPPPPIPIVPSPLLRCNRNRIQRQPLDQLPNDA